MTSTKNTLAALIAEAFAPPPPRRTQQRRQTGDAASSDGTVPLPSTVQAILDDDEDTVDETLAKLRALAPTEGPEADGDSGDAIGSSDEADELDGDEQQSSDSKARPASSSGGDQHMPRKPTGGASSPARAQQRAGAGTAPAGRCRCRTKILDGGRAWTCPVCTATNNLPAAEEKREPKKSSGFAAEDEYLVVCRECGCRPLSK
jgi:hypothetical protein